MHKFSIKKIQFLKSNLDFLFKWFFIGFIFGNIFGSFLIFLRKWILWDGLVIFFVLLILETINYIFLYKIKRKSSRSLIISIRIGLLLGFLIDAYKVGS